MESIILSDKAKRKLKRENNLKVFINEICNHYRIQYKSKTIDFFPKSGKLCYMDYREWVAIEQNEYLLRITTYLDMQ